MARVRINRDERRVPFLSRMKGSATQITPNGCTYDSDPTPEPATGLVGAQNEITETFPGAWPGGNRSGE